MNENQEPPSFGLMFGLGVLLLIVSCLLCGLAGNGVPLEIGALGAFVTAFFPGYRGVFAGFVTVIGVVLLSSAIICGAMVGLGRLR